uniref:SagB/ThcOx family dehydrogenase n=1 Tax=candidate division WOR-3 bacterium TaxID=2052148 RepID=A0A7C4U9G6_UNCW3
MEEIKLPDVQKNGMIIEDVIQKRRSIRRFKNLEPDLQMLSNLLWAGQGITEKKRNLRASPSAGALYPLKLYLLKKDTLYLYKPETHSLKFILKDDKLKEKVYASSLYQNCILSAPIIIIIAGDFDITRKKYGDRAERYVYIEVGHCAQNILLEAVALGLGGVPVGAYYDEEIKEVLRIKEEPLYILPIGFPE